MGRLNFGDNLLDYKVWIECFNFNSTTMNFKTIHKSILNKGILSDVKLDGKILFNWTACLTSNFIPNFQNKPFYSKLQKYRKPEYELKHKLKLEA